MTESERLYFRLPEDWVELTEEQKTAWGAEVAAALTATSVRVEEPGQGSN